MNCGPAIVTELVRIVQDGGFVLGEGFDNDGNSLTSTDAGACDAITRPTSAQLEKQSQHQPCSTSG